MIAGLVLFSDWFPLSLMFSLQEEADTSRRKAVRKIGIRFMAFYTFERANKPNLIPGEPQMKLQGKVILVTGASGGIGEALALAFAKEGAKVAIASRRIEKLEALAARMQDALPLETDLSVPDQAVEMIRKVVARYGRIDVLVNNAASIIVASSDAVKGSDLQTAFTTNLVSPVAATQEALVHMRRQGGGHIINVGSPGFMMGIPFYAPYVCSKAAFSAWTRTIQSEWAGSGITVSEYFPGYIKTDSRPDSRLGDVEQDFLMNTEPGFFAGIFTKPKTPESVARQMVGLVLKPRPLVYSGVAVKIGAVISNFSRFRLSIATRMARTARKKKNLPIFTRQIDKT
jgi:NAD(P)-dependent dehydrogenase (short-subunit alcohol dehydrogenase family)